LKRRYEEFLKLSFSFFFHGFLDYLVRGCSADISWHISACLGLFPLTEYYSFYPPNTLLVFSSRFWDLSLRTYYNCWLYISTSGWI
jgi:hypothetical protein